MVVNLADVKVPNHPHLDILGLIHTAHTIVDQHGFGWQDRAAWRLERALALVKAAQTGAKQ